MLGMLMWHVNLGMIMINVAYLRRLSIVLGLGSSRANHACQSRNF